MKFLKLLAKVDIKNSGLLRCIQFSALLGLYISAIYKLFGPSGASNTEITIIVIFNILLFSIVIWTAKNGTTFAPRSIQMVRSRRGISMQIGRYASFNSGYAALISYVGNDFSYKFLNLFSGDGFFLAIFMITFVITSTCISSIIVGIFKNWEISRYSEEDLRRIGETIT
jgi:hypothetical protein